MAKAKFNPVREKDEPITEEYFEYRLNLTAKAHQAAGFEAAAGMLLEQAAEEYKRDSDAADVYKAAAKLCEKRGKELRQQQRKMMQDHGDPQSEWVGR